MSQSPTFYTNLVNVNKKPGDIYSPYSPGQLVSMNLEGCPHAFSSYWTEARQMFAHNNAPGAESSLERFIVKCALTFGGSWCPPLFYRSLQQQTVVHISLQTTPGAVFGGARFSDVLGIMSHILMSPG